MPGKPLQAEVRDAISTDPDRLMPIRPFRLALPLLLLLASGCASVQPLHGIPRREADQHVQSCARWFDALDAAIWRARVRDAAAFPLPGFAYLRVDRFHASLADSAAGNPAVFEQWVGQMRALDREARSYEIANLPTEAFAPLDVGGAAVALQRSEECAQRLLTADLSDPQMAGLIAERARVPDHYLGWRRVVGLYPIVRLPFHSGVRGWQREAQDTFRKARGGEPPAAELSRYLPPDSTAYSRAEIATLLARADSDPLGTPRFSPEERERLGLRGDRPLEERSRRRETRLAREHRFEPRSRPLEMRKRLVGTPGAPGMDKHGERLNDKQQRADHERREEHPERHLEHRRDALHRLLEFSVQPVIAAQVARIQQRRLHLHVGSG